MESLILSPMLPNQDLIPTLITVSASPRNGILNRLIRNYLWGHLPDGWPLQSPEGRWPAHTPLLCACVTSLSHLRLSITLPVCTAPWSSFYLPDAGCTIHESLNKANKILKIYSAGFCFLMNMEEWTSATHNMDEPQKQYAKLKGGGRKTS